MENIDYLKGDKKFDWASFADNIIPYITDINTKILMKQENNKFEKSNVLHFQRYKQHPLLRSELIKHLQKDNSKNFNEKSRQQLQLLKSSLKDKSRF